MEMTEQNSRYIGDGVYAGADELGGIWLYTGSHNFPDNKIYLEFPVFTSLIKFAIDKSVIKNILTKF